MHDRREMLRLLAGAGAVGLAGSAGAALGAAEPRRSGVVGGRRVRTVDIHCHTLMDMTDVTAGTPLQGAGLPASVMKYGLDAARVAAMDAQGIDVQALSINAWWYGADRALAAKLIEAQNNRLAEAVKAFPGRFVALASVALQHPELAAEQLQDAIKRLGMKGVALGCSVEGDELTNPRFDPFWKMAESLGAVVFLHPQNSAIATGIAKRVEGNGNLANVIGNPLETTIALSHMIFEGTLDRFPGLKVCAAHGGGYLPSYVDRSDWGCAQPGAPCKAGPTLKRKPSEYMRQIYVDTLVFTPEAVRHLAAVCGPDRMMIGTDYPFPWVAKPLEPILATPGLSDADKIAMMGGTACKLLGIPA